MPNYKYEIAYRDYISGVISANNIEDAEWQIEKEFTDYPKLEILEVEEVIE